MDAPVVGEKSKLAEALLTLVGWGLLSCPTAGLLARCAVEDGANKPDLRSLAHIGTHGSFPGNSRRDLLRSFWRGVTVPAPLYMDFPVLDKLKNPEVCQQGILQLPEVLESLWQNHREQLYSDFLGPDPASFWAGVHPNDPKLNALGNLVSMEGWQNK
eukprot:8225278-Lingulodinium_polyedra.AAC.1